MRGAQVRSPSRGRFIAMLVALVFSVGSTGCTSSSLAPVGTLVPATDAHFRPPVGAAVTLGSSQGMESSVSDWFWWLTSAGAVVTVSNNFQRSPVIDLTARLMPPPCSGLVEVVVDSPGSPTTRVVAGSAGKLLSLRLNVSLGQSRIIHLSVRTPACHTATDTRSFYAGLYSLKAG
jgi:hypothetical protein